jgi:hypothetical protein
MVWIGRVINNYLLIRAGYVPINIKFINRAQYYDALQYSLYENNFPETIDRTQSPRLFYIRVFLGASFLLPVWPHKWCKDNNKCTRPNVGSSCLRDSVKSSQRLYNWYLQRWKHSWLLWCSTVQFIWKQFPRNHWQNTVTKGKKSEYRSCNSCFIITRWMSGDIARRWKAVSGWHAPCYVTIMDCER